MLNSLGHLAPILYMLFLWWFTTGLILWLDRLGPAARRWSIAGAGILALASLWLLAGTAAQASRADAYIAFTAATLIWGFVELTFLSGVVTGPRRRPCPPGARGLQRFLAALAALLYHELALLLAGLVVLAIVGAQGIGFQAYAALWIMRQSAKLNLFLGVRNPGEQFLPPQLEYLSSYFRKRPMNLLFPWSVLVLSAAAAWLIAELLRLPPAEPAATRLALLASLVVLGLLEHWFLVLPINIEALWRWSLRRRGRDRDAQRVDPLRALPAPSRYVR